MSNTSKSQTASKKEKDCPSTPKKKTTGSKNQNSELLAEGSPKKKYRTSPSIPRPKWGNVIDTFISAVPEVLIHVFTKNDKPEASYTHEMKKEWDLKTVECSGKWKVHDWMERKLPGSNNTPMTVKVDSDFQWSIAVSYTFLFETEETPTAVGTSLAKEFTTFAKNCPKVCSKRPQCEKEF